MHQLQLYISQHFKVFPIKPHLRKFLARVTGKQEADVDLNEMRKLPISENATVNNLQRQLGPLDLTQEHQDKLAEMRSNGELQHADAS